MSINITDEHYDFANDVVKIFGFKNLADFDSIIAYSEFEKNEKYICKKLNKMMDELKRLFVLKKFDLARLDYKIETTKQAFAFFKKVLEYMFIPYDVFRKKGKVYVRLFQIMDLYNNYIKKMSEIVQTPEPVKTELTPKYNLLEMENVKFSELVATKGSEEFETQFIITDGTLRFSSLGDIYGCINNIQLKLMEESDIQEVNVKFYGFGGPIYNEDEYEKFDKYDLINININQDRTVFSIPFPCHQSLDKMSLKITNNGRPVDVPIVATIKGQTVDYGKVHSFVGMKVDTLDYIDEDMYTIRYSRHQIMKGGIRSETKFITHKEPIKFEGTKMMCSQQNGQMSCKTNSKEDELENGLDDVIVGYFNKLVEEDRVSERVVSIKDYDDVLITIMDNKKEKMMMTESMFGIMVLHAMETSKRKKYGGSMLSNVKHTRKYHGSQINIFNALVKYHIRLDGDNAIITYVVSRFADLIKNIEFTNIGYNNPDSVAKSRLYFKELDKEDLVIWQGKHKTSDKFIIDNRYTSLLYPKAELMLEVSVPKDEFKHWVNPENRVEYVFLNNDIRHTLVDCDDAKGYQI